MKVPDPILVAQVQELDAVMALIDEFVTIDMHTSVFPTEEDRLKHLHARLSKIRRRLFTLAPLAAARLEEPDASQEKATEEPTSGVPAVQAAQRQRNVEGSSNASGEPSEALRTRMVGRVTNEDGSVTEVPRRTALPPGTMVRFKPLETLCALWPHMSVPPEQPSQWDDAKADPRSRVLWWIRWSRGYAQTFLVEHDDGGSHVSCGMNPFKIPREALEVVSLPPVERGAANVDALAAIYGSAYAKFHAGNAYDSAASEEADVKAREAVKRWCAFEEELRLGGSAAP